jgi:hypothetical protein
MPKVRVVYAVCEWYMPSSGKNCCCCWCGCCSSTVGVKGNARETGHMADDRLWIGRKGKDNCIREGMGDG